jgi:hypothetical protein
MPYENEFASYRPLRRIVESERVRQLLSRSRTLQGDGGSAAPDPTPAPETSGELPEFIVAVDGSAAEVDVKNGYPGARVGYCTVASVLLNLREVDALDDHRPVDPRSFRQTEQASTIDAALPGANVVVRNHTSARASFREALYETFNDVVVDEDDRARLLETFEALLALKPLGHEPLCPYEQEHGCQEHLLPAPGTTSCACARREPIFSTDALRIHERFRDVGTNGEAYGEVMQVWERVLIIHLLRCFERRGWLGQMGRVAFFLDGPLAVFGHPAWLSAAIGRELKRLNRQVRSETGNDVILLGIEKSGAFVEHFDSLDQTATGEPRFSPGTFLLPTDTYIKERIIFSSSPKRYGEDTYFGRKLFYKTRTGSRIVCNIPFLTSEQDTLASDDTRIYPRFATICALLDKLVSSRYPNALAPIVSAHAQAAIPLQLGSKVLQQLAIALMRSGQPVT